MAEALMEARRPRSIGKRVGLIIPSVNATIEPDYAWAAPAGLSFHATRVMLRETTPEGLRAMNAEVEGAARLIASVAPDVVAFACTSGTFLDGEAALARQVESIRIAAGCPVVATSRCIVEAMKHLGVRRVALATPYLDVVNEAERTFLSSHQIEVVSMRGLGLSGGAIREVSPEDVMTLVRATDVAEAEAIFVSCTDFRAFEVIERLESECRKPVLTSNQVTLWGILRALDKPAAMPGFGRLLADRRPAP